MASLFTGSRYRDATICESGAHPIFWSDPHLFSVFDTVPVQANYRSALSHSVPPINSGKPYHMCGRIVIVSAL
jgi:hypothetical protein